MEIIKKLHQGILQQKSEDYKLEKGDILLYKGRTCLSNSQKLKNLIIKEMHNVPYAGHLGYQKTIVAVKSQYYWPTMKKEVANFIAWCLE